MKYDLGERSLAFSVRAVNLYRYLEKRHNVPGQIIGRQFLRSATSIGANLAEGAAGETRKDFIHKYALAQKEARESRYWLRLMAESELISPKKLAGLIQESEELVAIITSIIVKAKQGQKAV